MLFTDGKCEGGDTKISAYIREYLELRPCGRVVFSLLIQVFSLSSRLVLRVDSIMIIR